MNTFRTRIRRGITGTAIVATATGFAALALAGPASAGTVTSKTLNVKDCLSTNQTCDNTPGAIVNTKGEHIRVEFIASTEHCSNIIAHIIVDGNEWGNKLVKPGQSDGGYEIPVAAGTHNIEVRAEGVKGGCNTGRLASWKGTLEIEKLT